MSSTATIPVREVRSPAALRQAQQLRTQVFVREQGIAPELDRDGLDAASLHVLAVCAGEPVATGRLTLGADGTGVLARIAVAEAYRGLGLGARVVQALERLAQRAGVRTVTLHPHDYLEPFYARLGYVTQPAVTHAGPYRLLTMTKVLPEAASHPSEGAGGRSPE